MRAVDAVMAFPAFILAMGITAALGNSTANVVAAMETVARASAKRRGAIASEYF
jgi:ABC-type dipeptide/oligopeptide/nickel transport system permease subunit